MQENALRVWRLENEVTQEELADKLGVRQRTISSIEAGANTDFDNLREIFEITKGDVTPNMLILGHA